MGSDQKPKFVSFVRTAPDPRRAIVAADPAPVEIDLARTALLVVDMQNDFLHDEGWFAASGIDPAPVRRAIGPVKALTTAARAGGVPVVWVNWGVRADAANLPAFALERARNFGQRPTYGDPAISGKGRTLVADDWGAANIAELPVEPGDLLVHKHRLSGFWDNELDSILRRRQITTLVFAGINTDRCVFATLSDATFLGYDTILAVDACATTSPAFVADAIPFLVGLLYGAVAGNPALARAFTSDIDNKPGTGTGESA
jgi:ureidoacrylate peracid hydrolase